MNKDKVEIANEYLDYSKIDEYYGKKCGNWIRKNFNKLLKEIDDPYTDNFRYAKIGNKLQEKYYEIIKKDGCCGFADIEISHKEFGTFKIGFNYGH